MSRFLEILEQRRAPLNLNHLLRLFEDMLRRLDAESGEIELAFPCYVSKAAPVSGVESLLDYDVRMIVGKRPGQPVELSLEVVATVTSLCPCSREISDYGAHNQRSHITIAARLRSGMSPEELPRIAEEEALCEVFGLLKRPDEKWVTERAYDNPEFVEDPVRDIALRVMRELRIAEWTVKSENFESIHNHAAYAEICGQNAADPGARNLRSRSWTPHDASPSSVQESPAWPPPGFSRNGTRLPSTRMKTPSAVTAIPST